MVVVLLGASKSFLVTNVLTTHLEFIPSPVTNAHSSTHCLTVLTQSYGG